MNRTIKGILTAIILTLGLSITSFAAEKEIKVDLSEGYTQANFYFTFEDSQNYDITITNPVDEPKQYTILGDAGTVTIDNIIAGTYYITIKADSNVEFKSSPRVELLKNQADSSHGNISVSSNVSGLKIWFEDGVLKAKWDDTNVGRVNIQIMNPSTMEVISHSTVEGTEYSYKLAADIDNINFYIVPASSSKVSGAGASYSVKVVKNVPGDILFNEKELFNTNIYTFKAVLYGNTTITALENGNEVYSEFFKDAGEYDIEIPLNDLDNNMIVNVIDESGNLNSYKTTVTKDIIAPKFTIQKIDEISNKSEVDIIGVVTETNIVEINGNEVVTNQNGQFQYTFPLEIGDNNIEIRAVDAAGNETVNTYLVSRVKVNYIPLFIVIGVIILGVGGFFVYKRFFTNRPEHSAENFNNALSKEKDKKPVKENNKKASFFNGLKKEKKPKSDKPIKQIKAKNKSDKRSAIQTEITNKLIEKRNRNQVIGNLIALGVFTVCIFLIFTKVIMFTTVLSGSMEPTLKTGERAVYNRFAYVVNKVERGDIVCFYSDEFKEYFGKRVIGVGGDEISFADGYLLINGKKIEETYLSEEVESNSLKSFTVPDGSVFLLGDNRNNSNDSRDWDNPFIPIEKISGKYIGKIILP